MNSGCIGIFDSGIGGLTSLIAIRRELPSYDYVYLGDTLHAPYGTRTQEDIYTLTKAAVITLRDTFHAQLIIIACNTASVEALRRLQEELAPPHMPFRILGIVVPLVEAALEITQTKHVALLATPATVQSNKYQVEAQKRDTTMRITQIACPLLVPLIEDGRAHSPQMSSALESYIVSIPDGVDTVVLGCTHYSHVTNEIRRLLPKEIHLLSEESVIGIKTREYLASHPHTERTLSRTGTLRVFATKKTPAFWDAARALTGTQPEVLSEILPTIQ